MQGREDILKMLDEAVYGHVLGQLPPDVPEIKALQEFADSLRKKNDFLRDFRLLGVFFGDSRA